jgi:Lon-like protease
MRRSLLVLSLAAVTLAVAAAWSAAIVLGVLPCSVVSTQPSCEVALVPGPTEDTIGLVRIEGVTTYPSTGRLLLTTIAVRDDLDVATWWQARRSRMVETVPRSTIYPDGQDREETSAQNALLMEDSQLSATLAALAAAGYDVEDAATGAEIVSLEPDVVTEALEVGDVIVAVGGVEVRDAASAVDEVRAGAPGDEVELTVERPDGGTHPVTVTYAQNPADASAPYVGVLLRSAIDLPVDVSIDAGVIGGPSAGLMFALGVLELLEEEDLTGGAVVAGTGTITIDGQVGAVGGVRQKLAAAASSEGPQQAASVFLVPRGNLAEARGAELPGELLLVPIDDLDGALTALAELRAGREPAEALALGPDGD